MIGVGRLLELLAAGINNGTLKSVINAVGVKQAPAGTAIIV